MICNSVGSCSPGWRTRLRICSQSVSTSSCARRCGFRRGPSALDFIRFKISHSILPVSVRATRDSAGPKDATPGSLREAVGDFARKAARYAGTPHFPGSLSEPGSQTSSSSPFTLNGIRAGRLRGGSSALVVRIGGIGTQRPGLARKCTARSLDTVGGLPQLHPGHDGAQSVEIVETGTATAMRHARIRNILAEEVAAGPPLSASSFS